MCLPPAFGPQRVGVGVFTSASGGGWGFGPTRRRAATPSTRLTAGPKEDEKGYNLRRGPRTAGPAVPAQTPQSPYQGPSRRPPLRRLRPPSPPEPAQSPPQSTSEEDPRPAVHQRVRSPEQFVCPECDRPFLTKIGLGVHRRRAHPEQVNAEIDVRRVKRQWSAEELRLMAREEALALSRGDVRFMNQHLMTVLPAGRSLDAVKGARRNPEYKALVAAALEDLRAVDEDSSSDDDSDSASSSSFHSASEEPSSVSLLSGSMRGSLSSPRVSPPSPASHSSRWSAMYGDFASAIRRLASVVDCIEGFRASDLVEVANNLLGGVDVSTQCCTWIRGVFPPSPPRVPRSRAPNVTPVRVSRKRLRRREYARVQRLFKSHMSRSAKEILDGAPVVRTPDVAAFTAHWGPFVTQDSILVPQAPVAPARADLEYVWHPVTCEETAAVAISISSAPGIDGITARQWRAVPASVKALFFNIVLASGGFPPDMLVSRTVFVPKKDTSDAPSDFRPISIASVVVRHLHKILAERLREAGLVDVRQRCLDDGCAENVAVLASLLEDSRRRLREIHVSSLDVAKAFDAVSHHAITSVLGQTGLPVGFRAYISRLYASGSTVFEVQGVRSERFLVRRGVRQGDPLSTLLFCLVVNQVLRAVPVDVGYEIGGCRVNALAYADDILLFTTTKSGMDVTLRKVEECARAQGLLFNARKCVALSIVPAGKLKKYKVLTDPQFHLADGSAIPQLSPSSEWRYLGVDFRPVGPKRAGSALSVELDRLTRAPLKPQQRIKILRCFLVPRFYHALVLAGTTLGKLRALDKQVRGALRRWLRLPHDTPTGYFHTSCKMGGIGVPSFATTVPGLIIQRLEHLTQSSSAAARAVAESEWVQKRLTWAQHALTKDNQVLVTPQSREKWWARHLYTSVDGFELRECGKSSLSNWWVDAGSFGIPGRDYVQYHHVRVNSLPTRVRTSRGIRRETREIRCRAGCQVTETAAHIVQACHRTHGGRVKRHNAVCRILASGLRNAGWTVAEEPRIQTEQGLRKPDLVAVKDGRVSVIDAQVVSGSTPLDDAHERKRSYYEDNTSLVNSLLREHGVSRVSLSFGSCTLSWRGVWSSRSADHLLGLGLPRRLLCGITTRVLQGSHTNWVRWNRMTGVVNGGGREGRPRTGIG